MKKINLFLASSLELQPERERFEIEIYRKCKAWFNKGIFLHLDIWEDASAAMAPEGSQAAYNQIVKQADIFILLVWNKLGIYSAEEFETAFGQFSSTQKPFIFTWFKTQPAAADDSLIRFQNKLQELKHFYAVFNDSNHLWNQFNKELERLQLDGFNENNRDAAGNQSVITGNSNIVIQHVSGSQLNIHKP